MYHCDANKLFIAHYTDCLVAKSKSRFLTYSIVVKYWVTVHTGEFSGAGTSSEVYMVINGERGDTGKRYLRSLVGKDHQPFQRGKMSSFCIEAVSLKSIRNIVIGIENQHDVEGQLCASG